VRVFVVGGTGAIGRLLVPLLVEQGHEVAATTRMAHRADSLEALGAEPVAVDALDAGALEKEARNAAPEVVICQVTSLSGDLSRFTELVTDNARVRPVATANTVAAAEAAGARRVVLQSIAFSYGPGEGLAGEDEPPRDHEIARAAFVADDAALASELEVVVARYGYFYGPGTWYARDGAAAEALRAGTLAITGQGEESLVHIADAAAATVALAERRAAGIYNVVDDEPVSQRVWMPAFAEAVGAPPPSEAERLEPPRRGASNAKIKAELGWAPVYPTWREGFREGL
jgi:nucleoside-diphosphate-sugar epimerase